MLDLGLKAKKILITASNGGLGPSIAKDFAEQKCELILVSKDKNKLEKFNNFYKKKYNVKTNCFSLNLEKKDSPKKLYNFLNSKKLYPDVIIHHLGGPMNIKSSMSSLNEWQKVFWNNFFFSVEFNRLIIPKIINKKYSRIINVSSISAINLRGSGPYGCAKAALNAYTITLGRELAKSKLVISAIMPGAFVSKNGPWDKNLKKKPKMVTDFLRHHHACGRLGKPEEISKIILMMSSKHNTFSNGSIINIDGGTM